MVNEFSHQSWLWTNPCNPLNKQAGQVCVRQSCHLETIGNPRTVHCKNDVVILQVVLLYFGGAVLRPISHVRPINSLRQHVRASAEPDRVFQTNILTAFESKSGQKIYVFTKWRGWPTVLVLVWVAKHFVEQRGESPGSSCSFSMASRTALKRLSPASVTKLPQA